MAKNKKKITGVIDLVTDNVDLTADSVTGNTVRVDKAWRLRVPNDNQLYYIEEPVPNNVKSNQVWVAELVGNSVSAGNRSVMIVRLTQLKGNIVSETVNSLEGYWIQSKKLIAMQKLMFSGRHILLVGPQGSGKTSLAYALCQTLKMPICKVDCGGISHVEDWFGSNCARNGTTIFEKSAMQLFIEEAITNPMVYHVILLDELNRTQNPVAWNGIMGLCDFTRTVTFTVMDKPFSVTLPKNVVIIATLNEGRQFTATHKLDAAVGSRFSRFRLGYMEQSDEVSKAAADFPGIDRTTLEQIVAVFADLREKRDDGRLLWAPSYREVKDVCILLDAGFSLRDAFLEGVMDNFSGDMNKAETPLGVAWSSVKAKIPS